MASYKVRRKRPSRGASEPRLAPHRSLHEDLISSRTTFQKPFYLAYDEYERVKDLQFIKDLFMAADEDGSGSLEYKEFAKCMSHPATFRIFNERFGLQRHQTPVVFRAFDLDGSGSISLPEWFETCTFLMQVVKDGDVITNWRQKDLRALKDSWKSWSFREQQRAPGSPHGGSSQGRPSGTSQATSPKRAGAAAERSGSRLCRTAPAVLGSGTWHAPGAFFVAETLANGSPPSVTGTAAASAPATMLAAQSAGGAAWAAGRGTMSGPSTAARGGMLRKQSSGGQLREPSTPTWREPTSPTWREPSTPRFRESTSPTTPAWWLTRAQSAPHGPGGAARRRSSSEAQTPSGPLLPGALVGGTAAEELEDRRRLARQRTSGASLPRVP